jgi:hypothetical protein
MYLMTLDCILGHRAVVENMCVCLYIITNEQPHLEASFHLLLNFTGGEVRCNSELSH